ncbi:MAG: hypothetical protein KAX49_15650, partial [Halanaerobiales bacterium]|nr:hypothetical protein [Halanaerobiales bacterium]
FLWSNHIIGYKNQGESIILNIGNQFVGVIDSYKVGGRFLTKELLENKGITKLNFICWTHTDLDHSKGLSELFEYVTDETVFILPEGISRREILNSLTEEGLKTEYGDIFNLIEEKITHGYLISANHSSGNIFNFNFRVKIKTFNFSMEAIAPVSYIVRENTLKMIKDIHENNKKLHEKPNYYSIVLRLQVKVDTSSEIVTFCLTGDLDNHTIDELKVFPIKDKFGCNTVFKIPHHGSTTANKLVDYLEKFNHAVSTSFRKKDIIDLPNKEIIEAYKMFGDVHQTGISSDDLEDYGYIVFTFPLENFPKEIDVKYEGAAKKIT